MKTRLTVLLAMINVAAMAQFRSFSITAGPSYTHIPAKTENVTTQNYVAGYYEIPLQQTYTIKRSYPTKVGATAGAAFEYGITKRLYLASGLRFELYRHAVKTELLKVPGELVYPGNLPTTPGAPYGAIYQWDTETVSPGAIQSAAGLRSVQGDKINTYYLGVPLLAGTTFFNERLRMEAGFHTTVLMGVSARKTGYTFTTEEATFTSPWNPDREIVSVVITPHEYRYTDTSTKGFERVRVSLMLQTTYLITRHIGATLTGQYFTTPVYQEGGSGQKAIAAGVQYRY